MSVDALRERYLPALRELLPARARGEGRALPGHARARRHVPRGARRRRAAPRRPHRRARARAGRQRGPTPAGRRRSRARCSAATPRRARRCGARARPRRRSAIAQSTGGGADGCAVSAVLIAAPLRLEAALIRSAARGGARAQDGDGPARALAAAAGALARAPGEALLVLGFCGGLDAESMPGEVIVAEEVYAARDEGHDVPPVACADAAGLVATLRAARAERAQRRRSCVSPVASASAARSCARRRARGRHGVGRGLPPGAAGGRSGSCASCSTAPATSCCVRRPRRSALRAARVLRRVAGALHDWAPGD